MRCAACDGGRCGSLIPGQKMVCRHKTRGWIFPVRPPQIATLFLAVVFLVLFVRASLAAQVEDLRVKVQANEVYVTAATRPDAKLIEEVDRGLSKEFIFYIDLFRVWKIWPNEFIRGRKLVRTIKGDPIKREYVATSLEGSTLYEKRFRDIDSMVDWTLKLVDFNFTSLRGVEPGDYFIRVTVESHIRQLPPVIGYLLFFIPENEFSITKDSAVFSVMARGRQ